ncbi:MAG: WD40/YVTN/BNR-like repeat-containing protein, partial [Candidatus Limnocylindria bacterium]
GLALHSIAIDAADPARMAVAISAGGAFASRDGGRTWRPWNEATRAEHLPKKRPEVGQCVHHLVAHPRTGGVWFQRNHSGVYWRDEGDTRWTETTEGLPSEYGFAGALHPHDPATAYVIPLEPRLRMASPPGIAVYRTRDRGQSWARLASGLPRGAALEVMREGLCTDRLDPAGLYFGATNGELWASRDEGRRWTRVAAYLPPILSVSTATLA